MYYLFNAVPATKLVCSRSSSLWGPYGETMTMVTAANGGHQGGIVDLPDGSYWGYIMKDDGAIGRMTRICPITWQNNWPMFGRSVHLNTVESSYAKPIANKSVMVPATSDEFNSGTLGLQWMWNHNPDHSKWSLTGSTLRLNATTSSDFWHARNSLTQKGQGLTSSGSIKIDCSAIQSGDVCGLGMLGDPRGYIAVTKDSSGKKIIMSEEDSVKATVSGITATILYFRIEMNFSTGLAKFFWRDDSTTTWQQLGTTVTMGYDWQYGTFQGEQYAILCFNPSSSSGYMDVDWFRFNDVPGGTVVECENMTTGGTYAGKISSPFSGVALYANNDYCAYTQYFAYSTHDFSVRGCANNSGTARVDLQIGGTTVGSFYFTGTTPTVQTLSNITHGTGSQEVRLTVTTDNGSWDAYVDYLQIN